MLGCCLFLRSIGYACGSSSVLFLVVWGSYFLMHPWGSCSDTCGHPYSFRLSSQCGLQNGGYLCCSTAGFCMSVFSVFFFFFFFPSSILLHAALLSFSLFGFVRFTSVLRIISFVYCLPMLSSSCSVLPFLPVFLVSGCLAFQFRCVLRLLVSAFHVPFLLCSASGAVSFCITFP